MAISVLNLRANKYYCLFIAVDGTMEVVLLGYDVPVSLDQRLGDVVGKMSKNSSAWGTRDCCCPGIDFYWPGDELLSVPFLCRHVPAMTNDPIQVIERQLIQN